MQLQPVADHFRGQYPIVQQPWQHPNQRPSSIDPNDPGVDVLAIRCAVLSCSGQMRSLQAKFTIIGEVQNFFFGGE
jgi:hypothetical protein